MNIKKLKLKTILGILIPLAATISLTIFLQNTIINKPEILQNWLKSFGVYTILVYIIIQSITIIIAPLGGFAAAISILAIFGAFWGSVIIYIVSTPAYIVNFWIAKKYGRRVVKKLIGESGLKIVDKYSQKLSIEYVIILKLLFGGYFDYISYAVGFSNIKFKPFILINFIVAIPNMILNYIIFKFSPNFSSAVVLSLILPTIINGLVYLPFRKKINRYLIERNLVNREV